MADPNSSESSSSDIESLEELIQLKEAELHKLKDRLDKKVKRRRHHQESSDQTGSGRGRTVNRRSVREDAGNSAYVAAPLDELEEPEQTRIFDDDGEFQDNHSLDHYVKYQGTETKTSTSRRSKTEINTLQFMNFSDSTRPDTLLERIIESLFDRVLQGGPKPTYIGFQVLLPSVGKSFYIPLRSLDQNNPKSVAAEFAKLNAQSNGNIDLQSSGESVVTKVYVQYGSASNPLPDCFGGGGGRRRIVSEVDDGDMDSHEYSGSEDKECTDAEWSNGEMDSENFREEEEQPDTALKEVEQGESQTNCADDFEGVQPPVFLPPSNRELSTLITVSNPTDTYCMVRSIVCGMAWYRWQSGDYSKVQLDNFIADRNQKQTKATSRLIERARLPQQVPNGYGLVHLKKIQAYFDTNFPGHYRLAVFHKEKRNNLIWVAPNLATETISLHYDSKEEHYNFIGKPAQLFKARDYCFDCKRVVYPRVFHPLACKAVCHMCLRYGTPNFPCQPVAELPRIRCTDCGFVFENASCFEYHKRTHQRVNRINRRTNSIDARCLRQFRSMCETRFVCKDCHNIVYTRQGPHNCNGGVDRVRGEVPCEECDIIHTTAKPFCFIKTVPELEDGTTEGGISKLRYVWFDAETTQNHITVVNGREVQKHIANLIIAEFLCAECIREGITTAERDSLRRAEHCSCGISLAQNYRSRKQHYRSRRLQFDNFHDEREDVVQKFLDWLLHAGPTSAKSIVISHNGGRFDIHLLLEKLMLKNIPVSLVMTGLKIFTMQIKKQGYRHLVFKDSLNFFIAPLSALPSLFGLAVEEKGYFPHLFNTREHLNRTYTSLPDPKFYGFDNRKTVARDEFIKWYNQNHNRAFCLRKEIVEYCRNDVEILREATLCFLRNYDEIAGVNPFNTVSTIAGLALHVYRKRFMPENALVNVGEQGYRACEFSSDIANKFMRLFETVNNCQIRNALWSIGEERVGDTGKRIDGVIRTLGQQPLAIEFQGCFYHGCLKCYRDRKQQLSGGRTAEQLLNATRNRIHFLQTQGYKVKEVWECEFHRDLQQNPDLQHMFDQIKLPDGPLNPRKHVLRGGRVEPFMLHYECTEDEEIIYVDVVSLYPYVMKALPFPIGDPEVLTRDQIVRQPSNSSQQSEQQPCTSSAFRNGRGSGLIDLPLTDPVENPYKGLLLVHILPPTQLHPVLLAYRTKLGHLVFTLCAACAETRQQERCFHTDLQRSWITGYTHAEVNEALRLGYTILDIFEVWHYENWADVTKGNALFTKYINQFLKYKVEASGWPEGVVVNGDSAETVCRKADFCNEYQREEGITIDPSAVKHNPGKRQIAKLMLNSAWGKLAQRADTTAVSITTTSDEFIAFMQNAELEIIDVEHITEDLDRLVHRKRKPFVTTPKTNNVPIAAIVTSYARLHLYKFMCEVLEVGGKLLYCDTDAIVYAKKRSSPGCTEGKRLGQMSREMPRRRIIEFISAGPRNYGFRHVPIGSPVSDTTNEKSALKISGFDLNYNASQKLTFATVKALVFKCYRRAQDAGGISRYGVAAIQNDSDRLGEHQEAVKEANQITINFSQIAKTKAAVLYNRPVNKKYRVAYVKGRVLQTLQIEPYGYRE